MVKDHCDEHSGVCKAVDTLEDQVEGIYAKLDKINARSLAMLTTLVFSLIGIIATFIVVLAKG